MDKISNSVKQSIRSLMVIGLLGWVYEYSDGANGRVL